jgi:hypothetical protein
LGDRERGIAGMVAALSMLSANRARPGVVAAPLVGPHNIIET